MTFVARYALIGAAAAIAVYAFRDHDLLAEIREKPAARELYGYALLAGAGALVFARGREMRDTLRKAVHKAATLVPPPPDDELDAEMERLAEEVFGANT